MSKFCNVDFSNFKNIQLTDSGCWEWKKASTPTGYGIISFFKRNYYTHRVMYRVFNGEIPNKHVVMHKCDNPKCINPLHLDVGTIADNNRDMFKKGRARVCARWTEVENNPKYKFTTEDILEMRFMLETGFPKDEIIGKFGVSNSYLNKIKNKKTRELK